MIVVCVFVMLWLKSCFEALITFGRKYLNPRLKYEKSPKRFKAFIQPLKNRFPTVVGNCFCKKKAPDLVKNQCYCSRVIRQSLWMNARINTLYKFDANGVGNGNEPILNM